MNGLAWRTIRERGSERGMRFTLAVYHRLGRSAADIVLRFVVSYFFLTGARARRASIEYLKKVLPNPTLFDVCRHFFTFASTSLDRFDVWCDRLEEYTFHYHGEEHVLNCLNEGRGAVLLSAHMGNFDTLRALGRSRGGKIHMLTDRRNSQMFSRLLQHVRAPSSEGVVEYAHDDVNLVFKLREAIARGEFVGLLGDRVAAENTRGAARVTTVPFLGSPAAFPQSPFLFAAHVGCPVLLLFGLRRTHKVYDLYVEPFADRIDLDAAPPGETLNRHITAYAQRLEHYCRQYPLQWFNFFPFWTVNPH